MGTLRCSAALGPATASDVDARTRRRQWATATADTGDCALRSRPTAATGHGPATGGGTRDPVRNPCRSRCPPATIGLAPDAAIQPGKRTCSVAPRRLLNSQPHPRSRHDRPHRHRGPSCRRARPPASRSRRRLRLRSRPSRSRPSRSRPSRPSSPRPRSHPGQGAAENRPQRPVPLRQRQEAQEVLPHLSPFAEGRSRRRAPADRLVPRLKPAPVRKRLETQPLAGSGSHPKRPATG